MFLRINVAQNVPNMLTHLTASAME